MTYCAAKYLMFLGFVVAPAGVLIAQPEKPKVEQSTPPAEAGKFFKLEFTVKEVEGGKVVNSRSYSAMYSPDKLKPLVSIRTGNRVPYPSGNSNFQYVDVGVNLDVRQSLPSSSPAAGTPGSYKLLALNISAEVSSVLGTQEGATPSTLPLIRQNRWTGDVLLALKKPTIIFSSDDLSSKRTMQVEVIATEIP